MSTKEILNMILTALLIFFILFTLLLIAVGSDKWIRFGTAALILEILWAFTS